MRRIVSFFICVMFVIALAALAGCKHEMKPEQTPAPVQHPTSTPAQHPTSTTP